ncbi:MAG: hypothetical protein K8H88_02950, partial [Sandaracinaceae bacterium]|nr:hypothetical protein [Sandaracinaceae bacterium]
MTACGAPSPARPAPSCDEARDRAVRAWTALAAEVEPGEPRELPPTYAQLETLRERLAQHGGEDVTIADAEAEALANALMDAIDACEGMLPAPLRDRAESAAEALLTERRDGADAVRDAIAVIDAMERAAHPDLTRVDPRAGHAQAELARRMR